MKTTLNKIKKETPCEEGWKKLLETLGPNYTRDKEISIIQILDSNGIADALWALRACNLTDEDNKKLRLFACDCTERVLKRERSAGREPDERSWEAIEISRKFAKGESTEEQLEKAYADAAYTAYAAANTASAAVADAAYTATTAYTAYAAANIASASAAADAAAAADDAADAAAFSASGAERAWQAEKFKEYFES